MSICLDCNSVYERPGTCNCFAPGGKRAPQSYTIGNNTVCDRCGRPYVSPNDSTLAPCACGRGLTTVSLVAEQPIRSPEASK